MIAARNAMLMGGAKLPYDAEVEYLESTGTQYIDTGIVPTASTGVFLRGGYTAFVSGSQICGARTGTTSGNRFFINATAHSTVSRFTFGTNIYEFPLTTDGSIHDYEMNANGDGRCFLDGVLVATLPPSGYSIAEQKRLYFFATSGYEPAMGFGKARIASCKMWQSDVLVRDFIPVRVGSGSSAVGYFYDRVSGELFGNAGTGAFVIGPDK